MTRCYTTSWDLTETRWAGCGATRAGRPSRRWAGTTCGTRAAVCATRRTGTGSRRRVSPGTCPRHGASCRGSHAHRADRSVPTSTRTWGAALVPAAIGRPSV